MNISFLPVEKRAGVWRVKWLSLIAWTLTINLIVLMLIYLAGYRPIVPLRHPVTVVEPKAIIYTQAATGATSHVEAEATQGDVVELQAMQPDSWCYVTLPASGLSGYVQQKALLIPDSTRKKLEKSGLTK